MNLHDLQPPDKFAPGTRVRLRAEGYWGSADGATGTVRGPLNFKGTTLTTIDLDSPNPRAPWDPWVHATPEEFDLI